MEQSLLLSGLQQCKKNMYLSHINEMPMEKSTLPYADHNLHLGKFFFFFSGKNASFLRITYLSAPGATPGVLKKMRWIFIFRIYTFFLYVIFRQSPGKSRDLKVVETSETLLKKTYIIKVFVIIDNIHNGNSGGPCKCLYKEIKEQAINHIYTNKVIKQQIKVFSSGKLSWKNHIG